MNVEFEMKPNVKNNRDLDMKIKFDHDGSVAQLHEVNDYKMRWNSLIFFPHSEQNCPITNTDIEVHLLLLNFLHEAYQYNVSSKKYDF